MKNKLIAVSIVAMLLLTGCIAATGNVSLSPNMTWEKLESIDKESADAVHSKSQSVTNVTGEDCAAFMMLNCGLARDQIGITTDDWGTMAGYIGLNADISKDLKSVFNENDFKKMYENSFSLRNVITDGIVTGPLFYNGQSAPIFPFTAAKDSSYSNENSDTIRYCIYVETDYDTDADGKRDLTRVFLSVPRIAMTGYYKAPVIFIADGYDMGETKDLKYTQTTTFDMDSLYSQPSARTPSSTADSYDLAMSSSYDEWGLQKEYMGKSYGRYSVEDYDYYLTRGFAVAICSGLGTYGSEGFQLSGQELELKAFEKVVKWFDGKAAGYTDTVSNIATVADWCTGKVGMYGLSYVGTVPLGLSMRNIDNLKTIASFGSIADWYEYVYRQGVQINGDTAYMSWFTAGNSSVFYDTERWNSISERYLEYLGTLKDLELKMNGSYDTYDFTEDSDMWSKCNYTEKAVKSDTSVLLVHGMFDFNVTSKETDIAYQTLKKLGMEVKVVLNQAEHDYFNSNTYDMWINGIPGYDLLNKWYSHYLFGKENGIENMSTVTVQSNVDGSWKEYDDFKGNSTLTVKSSDSGERIIGTETYTINKVLDDDLELYGKGVLKIKVKTDYPENTKTGLHVTLYDHYSEGFDSYCNEGGSNFKTTDDNSNIWIGAGHNVNYRVYNKQNVDTRLITNGAVNLHYPDSNYNSASVTGYDDLSDEQYREYTIYLDPTAYTLKAGHTLQIVLSNDRYALTEESFSDIVLLESIELTFDIVGA